MTFYIVAFRGTDTLLHYVLTLIPCEIQEILIGNLITRFGGMLESNFEVA